MASVLFADVIGILAKAQTVVTALKADNVAIPGAVTDLITKANSIITTWPNIEAPTALQSDLDDFANLASYLAPLLGTSTNAGSIANVVGAIQATTASAANLAQGELAVFARTPIVFNGTPDDVIIGAWRESGPFGQMVNDGLETQPEPESSAVAIPAPKPIGKKSKAT